MKTLVKPHLVVMISFVTTLLTLGTATSDEHTDVPTGDMMQMTKNRQL